MLGVSQVQKGQSIALLLHMKMHFITFTRKCNLFNRCIFIDDNIYFNAPI